MYFRFNTIRSNYRIARSRFKNVANASLTTDSGVANITTVVPTYLVPARSRQIFGYAWWPVHIVAIGELLVLTWYQIIPSVKTIKRDESEWRRTTKDAEKKRGQASQEQDLSTGCVFLSTEYLYLNLYTRTGVKPRYMCIFTRNEIFSGYISDPTQC